MINWRRIAVTGIVAGMIAVTGCSTNLPETNQGNRNGQRVADAVNRRPDTYRTTSNRLGETENNDGILGRTTRGIRNAADNVTNTTRNTGNYLNLGRPEARVGNTFRYGGGTGTTRNLNTRNTGHRADMGVTVSDQALVNSRTTRSNAVVPNNTNVNRGTNEVKPIDTKRPKVKHETKHEAKKVETAPSVTRSAPVAAPAPTPATKPQTAPRSVSRSVSRTTANHNTVNRVNAERSNNTSPKKSVTNSTTTRGRHAVNNQSVTRYGMTPHRVNKNNATHVNRAARRGHVANPTKRVVRNNKPISRNSAIDQTVAVLNTDDNVAINDDLAFFRKKTEETPVTPEVPTKTTTPEESYDDRDYSTTTPDTTSPPKTDKKAPVRTARLMK